MADIESLTYCGLLKILTPLLDINVVDVDDPVPEIIESYIAFPVVGSLLPAMIQ